MTEQELVDKIARWLYDRNEVVLTFDGVTYELCKDIYPDKVEDYLEQATQILALVKEADWRCWKSP